jgi:hypothetical protein
MYSTAAKPQAMLRPLRGQVATARCTVPRRHRREGRSLPLAAPYRGATVVRAGRYHSLYRSVPRCVFWQPSRDPKVEQRRGIITRVGGEHAQGASSWQS